MIDFTHIDYLKTGNDRQQKAYSLLTEISIFEHPKNYNATLTGTIPIGIDLPDSDLDIICECSDHEAFTQTIKALFSEHKGFEIYTKIWNEQPSTIASFRAGDFEIEIFAQDCPTKEQNAYKHMLIEHKILLAKGEAFRKQIIQLKQDGLKTEQAFANLLGLQGDPYSELLKVTSF